MQDKVAAPTRLMALRLYVNAFKSCDTRALFSRNCAKVLEASQGSGSFTNQQVCCSVFRILQRVAGYVHQDQYVFCSELQCVAMQDNRSICGCVCLCVCVGVGGRWHTLRISS